MIYNLLRSGSKLYLQAEQIKLIALCQNVMLIVGGELHGYPIANSLAAGSVNL